MRIIAALFCVFLTATLANDQNYKPRSGFVPDSATALKIAEAVLIPVYGEKQIQSEQPFTAKLKDGVWIVSGTLPCPERKVDATISCKGGVAVVQISKDDAHIISMAHYK